MTPKSPREPILDDALLARFVAEECTPRERARVTAWMAASPERSQTVELLRIARQRFADPDGERTVDLEGAWTGVRSRMQVRRGGSGSETIERGRGVGKEWVWLSSFGSQTLRRWVWAMGATITATLAVLLLSYRASTRPEVTRTYATSSGQQATFTLSDGTHITLAPRTTLRLIRFGSSSRTVVLDGQAYFEVPHDAGAPFLVRTGTVATQVLGTAFLVRHYTNEGSVHVAVAEGKVRIVRGVSTRWPAPSPLTLTSGHAGDVTDSTVQMSTVDLTPETDWLRGRLVFRHMPVVEVLQKLSQWYGYQFRCNDSTLTKVKVTLALSARSSAEALSTLEQILSVHLTIVGDTVTLTPHATQTQRGTVPKQMYDVWIPTREVGR